jgi:protein SCO1/2
VGKRIRGLLALLLVIVAAAGGGWWAGSRSPGPPSPPADEGRVLIEDLAVVVRERPKPLAPFVLNAAGGAHLGHAALVGHWTLLFFGYTFCPDVCPGTLATLAQVADRLEAQWTVEPLQVLMVSVDPERDTPQRLQDYVSHFHPGFLGATGERRQIDALIGQFRARYHINRDQGEHYTVDHTAAVFILDPDGRYLGFLTPPLDVDAIVKRLLLIRALYDQHTFK